MLRSIRGRLGGAGLALILSACGGPAASQAPASATPAATPSAYVADLDVGGGRPMHIVCVGPTDTGRPTVIFNSGLTGEYDVWSDVLVAIKPTDRACAYDKAGVGMSPPAEGPRTVRHQVQDLHALLAAAEVAPPYVLVGHSSGGWNVMVYTADYPTEVAGVVLVDIRPPATSRRILAELPPETPNESDDLHQNRAEVTTFDHDPTANPEGLDLAKSADEALAAGGFGDRPVSILWVEDSSQFLEGLDADLTARLMAVGDQLRKDTEALAKDPEVGLVATSHMIPEDAPDRVIAAIHSVFERLGG
jgi:pimeloyl-ACP methyl ester carboxylesterase